MSDTPTLKEALAWYVSTYPSVPPEPGTGTDVILAAARAYEAGQDIWWCEEHGIAEIGAGFTGAQHNPACSKRMVRMRLSPAAEI